MTGGKGSTMNGIIGQPIDRVDARLKVMGGAKYAAEFGFPGLVHAALVQSTISNGTIIAIDTSTASANSHRSARRNSAQSASGWAYQMTSSSTTAPAAMRRAGATRSAVPVSDVSVRRGR